MTSAIEGCHAYTQVYIVSAQSFWRKNAEEIIVFPSENSPKWYTHNKTQFLHAGLTQDVLTRIVFERLIFI